MNKGVCTVKILFLTLLDFDSLKERTIYTDLLRTFTENGHTVYVISPTERRNGRKTTVIAEDSAVILKMRTGNTQKTNIIEKGISTLMIEPLFKNAIRKYFGDVKFDAVIYSTPPITFVGAINYVRKRDGAKSYLLLKDIFPQNAVDLGMISKSGAKRALYKYFRKKEKNLYAVSDKIGCMSEANVEYVKANNKEVSPEKIEICPNCIEVIDKSVDENTRRIIREKYNIPADKTVFVYGGNLGKPQGVPFIIKCLEKCKGIEDAYFLIVGDGTEYKLLENYAIESGQSNLKIMKRLPKEDYDTLVGACDIGLIFLDHKFTIPNFPSRLLSYMQAKLPVFACTDPNTDIGKVITEGAFGWWCESNDEYAFASLAAGLTKQDLKEYGAKGFDYLNAHYSVDDAYKKIIASIG